MERFLQVVGECSQGGYPLIFENTVDVARREMYLCGRCGLNLDRNVPEWVLQRPIIPCPNCGAANKV